MAPHPLTVVSLVTWCLLFQPYPQSPSGDSAEVRLYPLSYNCASWSVCVKTDDWYSQCHQPGTSSAQFTTRSTIPSTTAGTGSTFSLNVSSCFTSNHNWPPRGHYPDFLRVVRCQASTRTGSYSVGAVIREYWPQCTENGKGNDRGKKRGKLGVRWR